MPSREDLAEFIAWCQNHLTARRAVEISDDQKLVAQDCLRPAN